MLLPLVFAGTPVQCARSCVATGSKTAPAHTGELLAAIRVECASASFGQRKLHSCGGVSGQTQRAPSRTGISGESN